MRLSCGPRGVPALALALLATGAFAPPAAGVDGRGRLGVVFGDGYVRGGRQGCCVTLEAMRLARR